MLALPAAYRGLMSTNPPDLSRLRIHREATAAPARGGRARWLILFALGLLAVLAFAFLRPRPMQVQVATAAATGGGSLSAGGITASGYVVARTKASVSAKMLGRLEYLGVQ